MSSQNGPASGEMEKRHESVPELVKDLTRDISELVRQEIELARTEMTEKGKKAGLGVSMFGGAAVLGMAGGGGSLGGLIIFLKFALPPWVSRPITTPFFSGAGGLAGPRRPGRVGGKRAPPPP